MRLADFIETNQEQILREWQTFAGSTEPGANMDVEALRDHAARMLAVIARDLRTPQTVNEQKAKSRGESDKTEPDPLEGGTAASRHGTDRADSGFTVEEMVAEFRALRSSVLRLWTKSEGQLGAEDIEDLTRFNEAIDQALAESVIRYSHVIDNAKEMFIAMLGHDLRTPLGAIQTAAQVILDAKVLDPRYSDLLERVARSAHRTTAMVGDLLDFTRSRLGDGIPVSRAPVVIGDVVRELASETMAANPGCEVIVETTGDLTGEWDRERIAQAFGNLIGNAVQHGKPGCPVNVCVAGHKEQVTIEVTNEGAVIPREELNAIFNPMKTRESSRLEPVGPTGSLGLGLYIAERIVKAHNGTIDVTSSEEDGTSFTICMPRK